VRRILPILFVVLILVTACVPLPPPGAAPAALTAATAAAPVATSAPEATVAPVAEATATPTAAATPANADAPLDLAERLPLDPAIRTGKLANGLTYYIRQNAEPAKRAEVWLAVNAGSVMENDSQKGLAHFLEHMLFKGTQRFPSTELLNFLQSIGMKFGPDINAYTSFDETVYTLSIPTEKESDVAKAFDLLQDWAGAATLSPEDFDKERGVIVEEWRLRDKTASGRMTDKIVPMLLGDSQYAQRLPIGDMEIVRNAPVDALRDFYRKWYRPDLMAVIAVGDFDVDQVETMVKERFSQLPQPADAATRPTFDVPARKGTSALVVKDPENPYTAVSVYQSRPSQPLETVGDYRTMLLDYLVTMMLNERYAEISQKPDAPFLGASAGNSGLVRPVDIYGLSAYVQEDKALPALDALMTEFERARRYGFTESEFERAKQDILRFYESANKEQKTSDSGGYANEYVSLFLNRIASPGIAYEYPLVARLLPDITLDDVNRHSAGLVTADNRAIILEAPEKTDLKLPTEAELTATVDAVEAKTLEPYQDTLTQTALLEQKPAPAAIVSETTLPDLGVTDIRLANGVRVLLKPTEYKTDEVVFSATSPGGTSLVNDADYPEAELATSWLSTSGVGNLTETQLTKLLAGKLVGVSPLIGELDEGFYGSASPDDLETALQLVYLYATQPRQDDNAFKVLQNQVETGLKNRDLDPESAFDDALNGILCGKTVRCTPMTVDEVSKLDEQQTYAIYKDRFADFSDFTFTFVGSFDVEKIKPLLQTYLGSLPSTGRKETWRNVRQDPPTGVVEQVVHKGLDERAHTRIEWTGPISPTLQNEVTLDVLSNVMDIRVVDELRQKLGGTYSPQAATGIERLPKPTYHALIDFVSDPKRVDELTQAVFTLLDDFRTNGPSETVVNQAKEQARLAHQRALEENSFWLGQIESHLTRPGDDGSDILNYEKTLAAVTAKDVQEAAQAYLPADRYVKVVLYPEKFDEKANK
jgi:zinc protease